MTETELAYIAGIMDGEGCISFAGRKARNGTLYYTPTLQVANTDKDLIDWLHQSLGGTVYTRKDFRPTRKPSWLWRTAGQETRTILRLIRPYLRIKARQADIVLSWEKQLLGSQPQDPGTGRFLPLSLEYHANTLQSVNAIRKLNHRGRSPWSRKPQGDPLMNA